MKKKEENASSSEMSLTGHLKELRNRVLVCFCVFAAALVVGLYFADKLTAFLLGLGDGLYQFVYISPQELLLQYVYVAFVTAICIAFPVLFYEVYSFVSPGLKPTENKLFLLAVFFGLIFFVIGAGFAYNVMIPLMLAFFSGLAGGTDIEGYVSVANYLSFVLTVLLIFGIVFEMPVVSLILNALGLIRISWLKKARRVVVVLIFLVAAVITPPDIVSQVITALPMIVLYELSIFLCRVEDRFLSRKHKGSDRDESGSGSPGESTAAGAGDRSGESAGEGTASGAGDRSGESAGDGSDET